MRTMQSSSTGTKLNIVKHIIVKNLWEYYVTDDAHSGDIVRCLVMGFETELGDVSLSEIRPYILTQSEVLDMLPAKGWEWVDEQGSKND